VFGFGKRGKSCAIKSAAIVLGRYGRVRTMYELQRGGIFMAYQTRTTMTLTYLGVGGREEVCKVTGGLVRTKDEAAQFMSDYWAGKHKTEYMIMDVGLGRQWSDYVDNNGVISGVKDSFKSMAQLNIPGVLIGAARALGNGIADTVNLDKDPLKKLSQSRAKKNYYKCGRVGVCVHCVGRFTLN
jgi:hypothetical protein